MIQYVEPISVKTNDLGKPRFFTWCEKEYFVSAIRDRWRSVGQWWMGEPARTYYRVEAYLIIDNAVQGPPRCFEIYRSEGQWILLTLHE